MICSETTSDRYPAPNLNPASCSEDDAEATVKATTMYRRVNGWQPFGASCSFDLCPAHQFLQYISSIVPRPVLFWSDLIYSQREH
jgi:hypothetical protein